MVCPTCGIVGSGLFLLGLALILWSADAVVDGIKDLGEKYHKSTLILALLIMGIDLEESMASIFAASRDLPEIALGNVIGNTIISLTFCFALPALIYTIHFESINKWYIWIVEISAILILIALLVPEYLWVFGIGSLFIFILYVTRSLKEFSKGSNSEESDENEVNDPSWKIVLKLILGLIILFIGSEALIEGTELLLDFTEWKESFFGLLVIAAATNIEEYFIMFKSIRVKKIEVGIGALIGKVLWNLCITFGFSALIIRNLSSVANSLNIAILLLIGGIIPVYITLSYRNHEMGKKIGVYLMICFIIFLLFAFFSNLY